MSYSDCIVANVVGDYMDDDWVPTEATSVSSIDRRERLAGTPGLFINISTTFLASVL